jgi:hypothetical protein
MTLKTYPDVEQGSSEWDDLRRGMVTASVVGQLITVSTLGADGYDCPACFVGAGEPCQSKRGGAGPIKTMHPERVARAAQNASTAPLVFETARNDTARSLTRLLVAERITGHTDPTYMSDDMERGWEDEPRAREKYAEYNMPVTELGFMELETPAWTLGYSPDGLVGDSGLIEIKSRRPKKHLQTILADQVPAENLAQIQAGLFVSGREWCDYISYSGGMPLWVKRVEADTAWHDAIAAAMTAFEKAAGEMFDNYYRAVEGLPMTKYVAYGDVELKL